MGLVFDIGIFLFLVGCGYFIGRHVEQRHYKHIMQREKKLQGLSVRTDRTYDPKYTNGFLVVGSMVVSMDYFKFVLAGLQKIFGGRMTAYESLLDRARREATLRMKEMAFRFNAREIINFRIADAPLSKSGAGRQQVGAVEVFAYGTALKERQTSEKTVA